MPRKPLASPLDITTASALPASSRSLDIETISDQHTPFVPIFCWIWVALTRLTWCQEPENGVNIEPPSLPEPRRLPTPGTPIHLKYIRSELANTYPDRSYQIFNLMVRSFDGHTGFWVLFYHISDHLEHNIWEWLPQFRPLLLRDRCLKHRGTWETQL